MDLQEILNKKLEEAEARAKARYEEALVKKFEDTDFIQAQLKLKNLTDDVNKLNTTIDALNNIPAFVANDGRKFSIQVFPVNYFPAGLKQLLGIIVSSRSAFTNEMMMQYSAISNISEIELEMARNVFGTPAYYKDGIIIEEIRGNVEEVNDYLESIVFKTGLKADVYSITQEQYDKYFQLCANTANKKLEEFKLALKMEDITTDSKFTIQ